MRLIKAGIPLIFAEEAAGYHHEIVNLAHSLKESFRRQGGCHAWPSPPELRPVLPFARFKTSLSFPERLFVRSGLPFSCRR